MNSTLVGDAPSPIGPGTLGRRLVIQVGTTVAIVAVMIAIVSFAAMREIVVQRTDSQLADIVQRQPNAPYDSTNSHGPRGSGGLPGMPVGGIIVEGTTASEVGAILTRTGFVVLSDDVIDHIIESAKATIGTAKRTTVDVPTFGKYRFQAIVTDGITSIVGLPLTDADNIVSTVLWLELALASLAIVGAIIVTRVLVTRNLRPLHQVAQIATEVSRRELDRGEVDLSLRVPESNADPTSEVGRVGLALNTMLGNVESALEARQASETKVRQFVADASHELRNPLAAIRGYAELTRRGRDKLPPDTQFAMGRIESESERMSKLVEDMLLLARLDNGPALSLGDVDLTDLVANATSDAQVAGPDHEWDVDAPEEPVIVRADSFRIHQVVANLLANARTHTPPGTHVTAGLAIDGAYAVLTVTDDGPGIAPELQPKVFERFVRADVSRARKTGQSTGLGLAIVAAVVQAHRGTVKITSRPGRTQFEVRLRRG
jgi:two-component system OmpR family sensor kinase